ncbi:hypothetical protein HD554DRAFT_2167282 [Boletus coccyginus]|nr:hypothetical protein HD554DRAFT_2167282 [Boletus coccyginus]
MATASTSSSSSHPAVTAGLSGGSDPSPTFLVHIIDPASSCEEEIISSSPPAAAAPAPALASGHPTRTHRIPARYQDQTPEAPPPAVAGTDDPATGLSLIRRVLLHVFDSVCTAFDSFGIAREYRHRPSY